MANTAPFFYNLNAVYPFPAFSENGGTPLLKGVSEGDDFVLAYGRFNQQPVVYAINSDGSIKTDLFDDGVFTIKLNNPNMGEMLETGRATTKDQVSDVFYDAATKTTTIAMLDLVKEDVVLVRVMENGSIDNSYGTNGMIRINGGDIAKFDENGNVNIKTVFTPNDGSDQTVKLITLNYQGIVTANRDFNLSTDVSLISKPVDFAVIMDDLTQVSVSGNTLISKLPGGAANENFYRPLTVVEDDGYQKFLNNVQIGDAEALVSNHFMSLTVSRENGPNAQDHFMSSYMTGITVLENTNGTISVSGRYDDLGQFFQNLMYKNDSQNPPASINIEATINDMNAGSQGAGGALSKTSIIKVLLESVNDAPQINVAIDEQFATEESEFTLQFNGGLFFDVDGDVVAYSAELQDGSPLPSWLTFDSENRKFFGTPSNDDVGSLNVALTATDDDGATITTEFIITIEDQNDAPVVNVVMGDKFAREGRSVSFSVPADTFVDHDAGDSIVSVQALLDGQPLPSFVTYSNRVLTVNAAVGNAGIYTITLVATDSKNLTVSQNFELDVANVISGTTAADSLAGGNNSNFYVINHLKDTVTEGVDGGTDTAEVLVKAFKLSDNMERGVAMSAIATRIDGNGLGNELIGNRGADILLGYAGNDTLDGGLGNDRLYGGAGNDLFYVNSSKDIAYEKKDEGTDTVVSSVNFNLNAATLNAAGAKVFNMVGVENLVLSGTANLVGYGNNLNNTITGNSGNNILNGFTGADTLIGGLGNDVYYIENVNDIITEKFNEGTDKIFSTFSFFIVDNVENGELISKTHGNVTGNNMANEIKGNVYNNILSGLGGNDTMLGSSGNDTLNGGGGKDYLDGGIGNDSMVGGSGNDSYVVNSTLDKVVELDGEGTDDSVFSSISMKLSDHVENLFLLGKLGISATGNDLDNKISGNAVSNILKGGEGADIFVFDDALNKTNIDRLGDFSLTEGDKIALDDAIFKKLASGFTDANLLMMGTRSIDANDYILYNNSNGYLYYDADGSGKGAAIAFAKIDTTNTPGSLTADDFMLI